jgi:hypothetical protein
MRATIDLAQQSMETYITDTMNLLQPQVVSTIDHVGDWVGVGGL